MYEEKCTCFPAELSTHPQPESKSTLEFWKPAPKELPQFSTPFLGTFWQHFGLQIRGYSGTYQIILQHNKILRDSWNTLLSIIRWEPGNKNTILGLNLYVSITSDTSLKCALKKWNSTFGNVKES